MVEEMNKLLEHNDVMVRIDATWYRLEEIGLSPSGRMDIAVTNDDGEEFTHFDMSDISEFDRSFELFKDMDKMIVGIA